MFELSVLFELLQRFYRFDIFLMSLLIYAGSMQFVTVPLLLAPYHFLSTVLLTLMVNARHLFYGLVMLSLLLSLSLGYKKEVKA